MWGFEIEGLMHCVCPAAAAAVTHTHTPAACWCGGQQQCWRDLDGGHGLYYFVSGEGVLAAGASCRVAQLLVSSWVLVECMQDSQFCLGCFVLCQGFWGVPIWSVQHYYYGVYLLAALA